MLLKIKQALRLSAIPVIFASLCCLSPLILVLLGLSTVSFATSLTDTLYGEYKWAFRIVGILSLLLSIGYYFYVSKKVCTLDAVKRRKNEIINTILLTAVIGTIGYIVFLYVIVHYAGVFLDIWK